MPNLKGQARLVPQLPDVEALGYFLNILNIRGNEYHLRNKANSFIWPISLLIKLLLSRHKNSTYILLIDIVKEICHIASLVSKVASWCYIKDAMLYPKGLYFSNKWFFVCVLSTITLSLRILFSK